MLRHYKGSLGEFDYDDDVFRVEIYNSSDILHYIGNEKTVSLPNGCTSTKYMFSNRSLPKGFSLYEGFDTRDVYNMVGMFYNCDLPDGFSLGSGFNTDDVLIMDDMFRGCHAHSTLNLGPMFSTKHVDFMDRMFAEAKFDNGLILGDNFDTSNVVSMKEMFRACEVGSKFSLGDKFDTSDVKYFGAMFYCFKFPDDFKFPNCFIIKDTASLDSMFYCTKFPKNFCLDIECNVTYGQFDIFQGCYFPEGFSFGPRFSIAKYVKCEDVFDDCYVDNKILNSALPCSYAIDVVKYLNEASGAKSGEMNLFS